MARMDSPPAGPSLRRPGRGASPSAKPYASVRKHHVLGPERTFLRPDVVLHSPQSLIPLSTSTTSPSLSGLSSGPTWCSTPRKALFLRRRAPRPRAQQGFWRSGRGASLPAKPYSFVRKHHAYRPGRASGGWGVVLHRPQSLIPPSGSTTPIGSVRRRLCWRRPPRKALTLRRATPTWPGRASGNPGCPFPIRRECDEHI